MLTFGCLAAAGVGFAEEDVEAEGAGVGVGASGTAFPTRGVYDGDCPLASSRSRPDFTDQRRSVRGD